MKRFLKKIAPEFIINLCRGLRSRLKRLEISLRMLLHLPLKKKRKKIKFEIHLVEHCNLNCAGCDNFSSIAEPEFVSVEDFKKDFERMGELFDHKCEKIFLIGGEPLLHPEFNEFVKIARENFTSGEIDVFTNGILLARQPDEFWKNLHDNKTGLNVTCYPININREEIQNKADKFKVYINWIRDGVEKNFNFAVRPLRLKGDGNYKTNFEICYRSNTCITLNHGKLYTCTMIPNVRHFNKFFKQNIAVTEKDYIDIYEAPDGEYILKKLIEPVPICAYCDMNFKNIKWHVSERKISEWT